MSENIDRLVFTALIITPFVAMLYDAIQMAAFGDLAVSIFLCFLSAFWIYYASLVLSRKKISHS